MVCSGAHSLCDRVSLKAVSYPPSSSCSSTTSLMSSQPTRTVPSSLMTPPSGRVTSNFAPPTRICAKRLPLSPVGVLGKKLTLNAGKSESTFFSSNPHEAKWRPTINLGNRRLAYNPSPKFLGVHLDRTLSFQRHVKYVAQKVESRNRVLASLTNKSFGWRKQHLTGVHQALQRSVMDYAASAYQPFLSATQLGFLEKAQNKSLRIITGQYSSTPEEALRAETGVPSYATHSRRLTAISYEKAMRLPPDHPRRSAAANPVRHRSKIRSSWRERATNIIGPLTINNGIREPFPSPFIPPWESNHPNPITLDLEKHCPDAATLEPVLDAHEPDVIIYTDGSCTGGTRNGGASAIVTVGPADNPQRIETLTQRGSTITCSYEEEKRAMFLAANWLTSNHPVVSRAAICTDSLSLLQSLANDSLDTRILRNSLEASGVDILLKFTPGHVGIPGNELADVHAKAATHLPANPDNPTTITFGGAKACIRAEVTDPPIQHQRTAAVYSAMSLRRDRAALLSRQDAVLLAQLRSGHCKLLAAYRNRIDDDAPPSCDRCDADCQDVQHWLLDCPGTAAAKQALFGDSVVSLETLTTHPSEIVKLAKRTLFSSASP